MFRLRALALALTISVSLAASTAYAAPSAKDRAEAKTLWTKGKRLASQKKQSEAIEALLAAVELDPKVQYELDLARALSDAGQLVAAREHAEKAAKSDEKNADRAKKAARELSASVGPRIPSLRVEVKGATDAKVTVDGDAFELSVDAPVDPGEHVIVGKTPSGPPVEKRVDVKEAQHEVVTLDIAATKSEPVAKAESGSGGTMAPAVVAYVVGGAALAAGGVLGGLAFMQTSDVETLCGGTSCPSQYAGEVALAQDYGTASTVLFAVGGLGVAAGLILTFTVGMDGDAADEGEKKEGLRVRPFVTPSGAGLSGTF